MVHSLLLIGAERFSDLEGDVVKNMTSSGRSGVEKHKVSSKNIYWFGTLVKRGGHWFVGGAGGDRRCTQGLPVAARLATISEDK